MAESETTPPTPEGTKEKKTPVVLMAIDHSKQAMEAFEWYAGYLHRPRNRLVLVHVAEFPHTPTSTMYASADSYPSMLEEAKDRARKLEEQYAEKMKEHGMHGRIRAVFHNRPGEAVIDIAKEDKVDMIVTGTRGMGAVRRTILGSVSDYIVHHSPCPVIITRHAHDHSSDQQAKK